MAAMVVLAIAVSFVRLGSSPPLWWDEGWTLTVARHWVEDGYYGQYLSGEPAARGLEAAFPVVASLAASFRVFGVGVWQGRLPGVLYTLGSLGLLCWLGWRLFRPAIAAGTLFVLLFLTGHPQINPMLNGRQVLADIPVVFFLLAGIVCLYWAWDHPFVFMPLTSIAWGLALMTKAQSLPFWLLSMLTCMAAALWVNRWKTVGLLAASGIGAWIAYSLLVKLQGIILGGHTLPGEPVPGLMSLVVVVPDLSLRGYAVVIALIFALPLACGLAWAGFCFIRDRDWRGLGRRDPVIKLFLFCLSGSWFIWYVMLSNGGERYLSSPTLIGSIFTASMLYDWSGGYDVRATFRRASGILRVRHAGRQSVAAFLVLLMVGFSLAVAFFTYAITWRSGNNSVSQIAGYINSHSPENALVESYESELFFFLKRPYHFPPDVLHGDLLRRYLLDPDYPVQYDPLAADPDYLVIGPTGEKWKLYAPALQQGAFRPLMAAGAYTLYERQRP